MESDTGGLEPERDLVALLCPECMAGKHRNCAEFTVDDHDAFVPCECPECDPSADPPPLLAHGTEWVSP